MDTAGSFLLLLIFAILIFGVPITNIRVASGIGINLMPSFFVRFRVMAATINNARRFKIDSQVGTIEPGRIANLVLLKKSPLESVDAYDSIVTVWIHGNQISRDSLAVNPNK